MLLQYKYNSVHLTHCPQLPALATRARPGARVSVLDGRHEARPLHRRVLTQQWPRLLLRVVKNDVIPTSHQKRRWT